MLVEHTMTGGVVSCTRTVNWQLFVFPLLSVATQCTVVVPSAKVVPVSGKQTTTTLGSQISLPDLVNDTTVPAGPAPSTMILVEHTIAGGVVSCTRTVNAQELVFPLPSVTTQLTTVSPGEKVEPDAGVHTGKALESQISLEETANVTGVPGGPAHSTMIFVEHTRTGGVVSITCTVKEQLFELPLASVAAHSTGVGPRAKLEPDAGVQTSSTLLSQMSLAELEKVTTVPGGPAHSTIRFVEHTIAGGVVSCTRTVNVHAFVFPLASVTVQ
jgi:hypothetical protein